MARTEDVKPKPREMYIVQHRARFTAMYLGAGDLLIDGFPVAAGNWLVLDGENGSGRVYSSYKFDHEFEIMSLAKK